MSYMNKYTANKHTHDTIEANVCVCVCHSNVHNDFRHWICKFSTFYFPLSKKQNDTDDILFCLCFTFHHISTQTTISSMWTPQLQPLVPTRYSRNNIVFFLPFLSRGNFHKYLSHENTHVAWFILMKLDIVLCVVQCTVSWMNNIHMFTLDLRSGSTLHQGSVYTTMFY